MKILTKHAMSIVSLALVLTTPIILRGQERVGTSCADCPNYSGAFSIENKTGVTIWYQMRWGDQNPWKSITLSTGHTETHSYPFGGDPNGRAPAPHVRFDRIAGDGGITPKTYHMAFHTVGYAGYGAKANNASPKEYYFEYSADGRTLDLFAR